LSPLLSLKLPFETLSRRETSFEPQNVSQTFNQDQLAEVAVLARRYDTSISVFLLACWQILLWRLTGQSDIVIGTGFDGRPYEELKEALGLFAKYLPIYGHLEETMLFSEVLRRVKESVHEAYQWQPWFTLGQNKKCNSDGVAPFYFPVRFDYVDGLGTYSAADMSFSIDKLYACIDRFKWKLSCTYLGDSLIIEFHYDAGRFAPKDIQ